MGQGDTSQIELTRTKREMTRIVSENKRLDGLCESLKKELDAAEYKVRDLEADLAVRSSKKPILKIFLTFISCVVVKAQSNNLVKEIKTKEKLEDRLKTDHEQMEKFKSELGTVKNSYKKAEISIEKLSETLKDLKVI